MIQHQKCNQNHKMNSPFRPTDTQLDEQFSQNWPKFPIPVREFILSTDITDNDVDKAMDFINSQEGTATVKVLSYAAEFLAAAYDEGDLPTDWARNTLARIQHDAADPS